MIVQLAEVRHYLHESDMWFVTRFQFSHYGKKIADYVDLGSLLSEEARKAKEPRLALKVVPMPYDLQSALFHLRTLRNRLFPIANTASMSLFYSIAGMRSSGGEATGSDAAKKKKKNKKNGKKVVERDSNKPGDHVAPDVAHLDTDFSMEAPSLADYFPRSVDTTPSTVKSISFSAWNPVPSYRRLQGDLFYVDIVTLENRSLVATASERGWFANNSSMAKFDPASGGGASDVCALLSDLLIAVSPAFKSNFAALNKLNSRVDSIEALPFGGAPPPWVGVREEDEATRPCSSHAEEAFLRLNGFCHPPGMERDWNEEYQILFAQANVTSDNRFATLNNLFRVHSEFVAACQKGAVAIVDGLVATLNPYDPPGSQMWMHNNIFFSIAANVNGMFDGLGGEEAAHKNASHEITGIRMLRSAGVPGLNACAQCVVDYRGRRVVCQSVVPGLLTQGDSQMQLVQSEPGGDEKGKAEDRDATHSAPAVSSHAFGPTDDMQSYIENTEFTKLTAELGKRLGLRSAMVKYGEKMVQVHGPLELRGLVGGDKRKYVFELLRMLPRDCTQPLREKSFYLYRPELVAMFREHVASLTLKEYAKKKKSKEEETKKRSELEEAKKSEGGEEQDMIYLPDMSVNVNLLVHDDRLVHESDEELKRERSLLDSMGKFLLELAIPSFIEVCSQVPLPSDLTVLVSMMHERGINARYLGEVATRSAPILPQLAFLCMEEMIVRAVKSLMRAELSGATPGESAAAAARILNRFLGSRFQKSNSKASFSGDHQFWDAIKAQVQTRFNFALVVDAKLGARLRKVTLLRSLCLAVGLTVQARPYNFESTEPFSADNILAFHPLARHAPPELQDISEMMGKARELVQRPASISAGVDMLEHAMQAVYHIMGPHTMQAATAHQLLANAYYQMGEPGLSVQHTERAVLILERLKGLDHESTVRAYGNLATFYLECGLPVRALPFVRRSLYLERLVNGMEDQAVPLSLTNLAAVLKELGDFEGATRALQLTLHMYERTSNEVMATHTCRELALCYQAAGAFKEALSFEKRYNKVLSRFYAADHEKVKESNELLSTLTGQAVHDAREKVKAAKALPAQISAAAPLRQQKMARGPMSVLPKPGANMQPLSRVLSMINKQKK